MVRLGPVTDSSDRELLRRLVEQHARFTGSARAKRELGRWDIAQRHFVAVVPLEYRRPTIVISDPMENVSARHG
jgi:glutamate synthase domain-containing protein 3